MCVCVLFCDMKDLERDEPWSTGVRAVSDYGPALVELPSATSSPAGATKKRLPATGDSSLNDEAEPIEAAVWARAAQLESSLEATTPLMSGKNIEAAPFASEAATFLQWGGIDDGSDDEGPDAHARLRCVCQH